MKKLICVLFLLFIGLSAYAFDNSLHGSWGLVMGNEKQEIISFNSINKEIILSGFLLRLNDYTSLEDTLHVPDFDGDSIIIQYYHLAVNKLLFILWNTDDINQSMTLILSKL